MDCEKTKELLWEMSRGELSPQDEKSVHDHIKQCPDCAIEFEQIGQLQACLEDDGAIDVKAGMNRVFSNVWAEVRVEKSPIWRPISGLLATAAVALFTLVIFAPGNTTAVTLDKLETRHKICLIEGRHDTYRCKTEASFAEMTISELGLSARPFDVPAGTFKNGDVCRIDGNKVAHAMVEVNGETVSYFRIFDAKESLKNEGNWNQISTNFWYRKYKGHMVMLRKFGKGDFGIYTGKLSLEDLERTVRGVRG